MGEGSMVRRIDEVVLSVKYAIPDSWDDEHREFMRDKVAEYLSTQMEFYMHDTAVKRLPDDGGESMRTESDE